MTGCRRRAGPWRSASLRSCDSPGGLQRPAKDSLRSSAATFPSAPAPAIASRASARGWRAGGFRPSPPLFPHRRRCASPCRRRGRAGSAGGAASLLPRRCPSCCPLHGGGPTADAQSDARRDRRAEASSAGCFRFARRVYRSRDVRQELGGALRRHGAGGRPVREPSRFSRLRAFKGSASGAQGRGSTRGPGWPGPRGRSGCGDQPSQ